MPQNEHEEDLARVVKWGDSLADIPRRNDGVSEQELRHGTSIR